MRCSLAEMGVTIGRAGRAAFSQEPSSLLGPRHKGQLSSYRRNILPSHSAQREWAQLKGRRTVRCAENLSMHTGHSPNPVSAASSARADGIGGGDVKTAPSAALIRVHRPRLCLAELMEPALRELPPEMATEADRRLYMQIAARARTEHVQAYSLLAFGALHWRRSRELHSEAPLCDEVRL